MTLRGGAGGGGRGALKLEYDIMDSKRVGILY